MNLPFEINLENKVVVVTGAGGVLCSMFARALAECGAKVALLDLNKDAAEKYAEEIRQAGYTAKAYEANVLNKESLEKAHQAVLEDMGTCDILINGAGGNNPKATTDNEVFHKEDLEKDMKTFFDLDPQGVEFVFSLNFMGTLLPTQIFAADMLDKEGTSILNISSMNAYTPLTKIPAYSGAKAAISNFTQWLAVHFAETGIRVNAMAPGFFLTNQNRKLLLNEDGTPTARTNKIISQTPMKRFGEDKELIGTLLYLVSEEAAGFVTGIVVPVDGGFSAYSGV